MASAASNLSALAPKPENLPSRDTIITRCLAQYQSQVDGNALSIENGMRLFDDAGNACAWVRFGSYVTMAEANTHRYLAGVTNGEFAASAHVRTPLVYDTFSDDNGWI